MEEGQGNDREGRPAEKKPQKKKRPAPKKPDVITPPSQTDDAAERQDETRKVEDQRKAEVGDTRKDVEMDSDDEETRQMGHSDVATECQKPDETPSDDLTEFKEQGEDTGPEELKGDEEHNRNSKRNTDDEETTRMGHGAEDEGQMREDRKDERLQAGGEEGDEEHVETDTSMNNHTTVSEVKSSEDEEAQDNKDRDIEENNKSGELNETRVEDASVNVGEQLRDSSEQHLDEETKTEKEEEGATKLEISCEMRQNEEDETRNDNEVLHHLTAGEEDNTEGNSNDKSEGLKSTKPSKRHLDEETVTEKEEQRVTPPQRRHHGLINQGATCYLNSVLQVLFMTTEIHHRLDPQTDRELRQIFTDLKTKTCRTENITRSLKIENVYEQRDAAECLQEILHHISPEASEVFQGQMRETTKCSKDHIINEEINPFWTLPLSLKDTSDTTYSVESSFKRTFQTKTYYSGNMMYCNDCKQKTGATSRCEMVEAPQILILLLKRFDFDYNTRSHFKSDCCVEVPCELQLETKTYKLYGMVNHMGSIRGGHYTATVLSEDNTWYECDDSHVSEVKHQLFAEDRTLSSRTVYLLTYRATELEMPCETKQTEEDEGQIRKDCELSNHQIEGEEDNAEENSNNTSEGLKKKGTVWWKKLLCSLLQKKWFSSSQATECHKPVESTSEDLTDEAEGIQGDEIGPEELKKRKEPKINSEINTDDEEATQMGHLSAEDEGKLRKDSKEERLQARGEEGGTTVSKVKGSKNEEAQENEDSSARQNSETAEFEDTRV